MKMKHWSIKEWHLALSSEKGKGSSGIPHSLHGLSFSLFSSFLLLSLFLLFFSRSFRSFFFFFSYHCATLHGNSTLAVGEAYTVWPCYFLIPLFCLVIQMLLLWSCVRGSEVGTAEVTSWRNWCSWAKFLDLPIWGILETSWISTVYSYIGTK